MEIKYLKARIRKIFEFCLCFFVFPYHTKVLLRYYQEGLTPYSVLLFLFIISKESSIEGDVLEIGSFRGSSSLALAAGNKLSIKKSTVWLIEPRPLPSKKDFLNNFKMYHLNENIKLIDKISEEARRIINPRLKFIFVDGDHRYEFVKKDILLWQDSLEKGGVIAFHDYGQPGVARAIKELITESNNFIIHGTIDGILYASRGSSNNKNLLLRLQKLENIRDRATTVARILKLY